jgi:hypothetical protein
MHAILWAVVSWLLREILIKFLVFTAVFALIALLVPFVVGWLANFIGIGNLTVAFDVLPAGIWYFLDLFRLDFGVPFVISSFVSRFLIRRLPVIG